MSTIYPSRTADKFVVRLPDGLRDEVQGAAEQLDTSMNTVFVQAVRQYLDGQQRQQLLLDALAKAVTGKEELDAVLHWRGKHAQAIRERDEAKETLERWHQLNLQREAKVDALQQRLTAADERADVLETALRKIKVRLDAYAESDMRMPEPSVEVCQSIADAVLRPAEGGGKPCACPGCDSPRRENSPFCVAHRSVKSRTRGQDPLTADGLEWLMQNDGLQQ